MVDPSPRQARNLSTNSGFPPAVRKILSRKDVFPEPFSPTKMLTLPNPFAEMSSKHLKFLIRTESIMETHLAECRAGGPPQSARRDCGPPDPWPDSTGLGAAA